ncbi:SGNH/GDSL hydrolase family protein [Burkholderia sp. PU8-34]
MGSEGRRFESYRSDQKHPSSSTVCGWCNIPPQTVSKFKNPPFSKKYAVGACRDSAGFKNEGVGGAEAFRLLSGAYGKHPDWETQLAQSKAQIVLLDFGLNDFCYWKAPQSGVYDESPSDYAKIIGYLIQTARDAGKIVVLQEPDPTCKQPNPRTIIQFVNALRSEASTQHAPLVAQFDFDQTAPNRQSMLTDCEHPNDQFYGIKAKQTFVVLEPIVQSPTAR